jgi:hypothetical protein
VTDGPTPGDLEAIRRSQDRLAEGVAEGDPRCVEIYLEAQVCLVDEGRLGPAEQRRVLEVLERVDRPDKPNAYLFGQWGRRWDADPGRT